MQLSSRMNPRVKKLIGLVGILVFLLLYMGAAVQIAQRLPDHGAARGVFFVLAGVLWGVPLFPLITWMNRN